MRRQFFRALPFTNASGSQSWRVAGTDADGQRVRENYPTKAQAETAADAYEVARMNAGPASKWRTIATMLTAGQLADAEAALEILPEGQTLRGAVEFLRERWRPAESEKAVNEAVAEYLFERASDFQRGDLGRRQLRSIRIELMRFAPMHEGTLSTLTQQQVLDYIARGGASMKTRQNRRGVLASFFRWSRLKTWMSLDPFADVRARRVRRRKGTATILSPDQAEALMRHAESHLEGRMVSYFALCLFAGIRPDWRDGEVKKLRPKHVRLDLGLIRIPPDVSKIGESREVKIRPNLRAWLNAYPWNEYPPIFTNHRKILPPLRKQFGLAHDVLRHSFCTYVYEQTGSLEKTAAESGNSVEMIRNHYRGALEHPEWTKQFWAIRPKRKKSKPLAICASKESS
ncbi:MAG: tyrosine-type recombinase/integrase [Opitutaceae bacterium]